MYNREKEILQNLLYTDSFILGVSEE